MKALKTCFFYAWRELRRRPREFLSLVAVTASLMIVLVLLLMMAEARWRADVMPDKIQNTHMTITCQLTDAERKWIDELDEVQATYRMVKYNERSETTTDRFFVRVTWDYATEPGKVAYAIFDELDLWSRSPYNTQYAKEYDKAFGAFMAKYRTENFNGQNVHEVADSAGRAGVWRRGVKNVSFCTATGTGYSIQPSSMLVLLFFSVFMGAALSILIAERYRRSFTEYGTLRAFGFTRVMLYAVNTIETTIIVAAATPLSAVIAVLTARIYAAATSSLRAAAEEGEAVYNNMLEWVPVSNIIAVSVVMIVAAIVGTLIVCRIFEEQSVIDLVTGRRAFTVSFVSKTSPKFEESTGNGLYPVLYMIRTRKSVAVKSLAVAVMLPLPMIFMYISLTMGLAARSNSELLTTYYFVFTALMLSFTAMSVAFFSSACDLRDRKRELSTFRALGASKKATRRVTLPTVLLRSAVASAFTFIIVFAVVCASVSYKYVGSTEGALADAVALFGIVGIFIAEFLLIYPPLFAGAAAELRRLLKRSIIDGIRENE